MAFQKSDLDKFRALKCEGNELYDLSVPGMHQMYDEIVRAEPAHAISRDTTSFEEIKDSINDAARKNQGDGIVILSGAYRHIIGAITDMQKEFNIEYVPVDGMRVSTATPDLGNTFTPAYLKQQMSRDIGVTKHIGFGSVEAAREGIESKPYDAKKRDLIVVVLPETPPHGLKQYAERKDQIFPQLTQLLLSLEHKPGFVSYIGEDLQIENIRSIVTEPKINAYPRNAFLQKLHQSGIAVEIGAFGHRDRAQGFGGGLDDFGISDFRGRFRPKPGGSQTFRGSDRTDPEPRKGGWSENT